MSTQGGHSHGNCAQAGQELRCNQSDVANGLMEISRAVVGNRELKFPLTNCSFRPRHF